MLDLQTLLRKLFDSCQKCRRFKQGCQMVYFQTKNPNLGKFWGSRNENFWYNLWVMAIWNK
jgi:hypothetical protein